jgi:hypothetical protein
MTIIILAVAALISFAIAMRAFLAPQALATGLGLGTGKLDGLNEVRAQYGGFYFAVAITCALGIAEIVPRPSALLLLAATFGGILFGRIVSAIIDRGIGAYGPTIRVLYVVDLVGFAAALLALRAG